MQLRHFAWPLLLLVAPSVTSTTWAEDATPVDVPTGAPAATARQPEPSQPTAAAPSSHLLQDDRALAKWVLLHSPDVNAARAERDSASANARGARLFANPELELAVGNFALGQTNPPGHPRDKTLLYEAALSQLVELGKRGPRIAAADLHTSAAQFRLAATASDRIGVARLALAQLVYAHSRAVELDASLAQARAAAEVAKGRLDHQALSGVDYDRLLIDLVSIESDSAHAHADAEAAEAQCAATLLAPCDGSYADVAALEPTANVPDSWEPAQLQKRSDIRALQVEGNASSREAELAGAKAIPDLTFRLGYAHDTFTVSGSLSNSLSLSVSAPLPVFDRGQHDKAAALARASQYQFQAHSALNHARGDVTALFTRKRALEGALERIERDALPRANGVLEAHERGLREGQLDITDLLLVRREAIALRLQTLDLHFELFQLRNELRQALGLDEALAQR